VDSLVAAEGSKIGLQLCGIQGKKLGTATKHSWAAAPKQKIH